MTPYPPQGMTPAEVGYVLDGTADKKDLISMILYFAEQGYLTIEQTNKKKFTLHKQCDIPQIFLLRFSVSCDP